MFCWGFVRSRCIHEWTLQKRKHDWVLGCFWCCCSYLSFFLSPSCIFVTSYIHYCNVGNLTHKTYPHQLPHINVASSLLFRSAACCGPKSPVTCVCDWTLSLVSKNSGRSGGSLISGPLVTLARLDRYVNLCFILNTLELKQFNLYHMLSCFSDILTLISSQLTRPFAPAHPPAASLPPVGSWSSSSWSRRAKDTEDFATSGLFDLGWNGTINSMFDTL